MIVLLIFITYVVPVIAGLFTFWSTSKKDGFDQEKVFDLAILSSVSGALLNIAVQIITTRSFILNLSVFNVYTLLFGFVLSVILIVKRWNWSVYRILDNVSVSLTLAAGFWFLISSVVFGIRLTNFAVSVLLFVFFYFLQKYRMTALKSGFTFCLINFVFCLAGGVVFRDIVSLIFIGLLFTLTLAVLIFRVRSLYAGTKKIHNSTSNA